MQLPAVILSLAALYGAVAFVLTKFGGRPTFPFNKVNLD